MFGKTKQNKDYTLTDGEEMHKRYPNTFEMPNELERNSLKPEALVKLQFNPTPTPKGGPHSRNERMWVLVSYQLDDGTYIGSLNNIPMSGLIGILSLGDIILFESKHVIQLESDRETN